jgi:HAD superfamily hydrolase (TIGR01509 family)
MIRALVFDCDGVLFDSWDANVAFYNAVLNALGCSPLDADGERLAHRLSTPQLFETLFAGDDDRLTEARAVARQLDYGPFYPLMRPVPGLYDLLRQLRTRYRLAMATNRGMTVTGVMAHFGLGSFLELAVGINDVARPKPFPDMLEHCLAYFGLSAAEAVYVGDAVSDYAAARAAGMPFVAVGDKTGAPVQIRDLTELPALLADAGWR